MTQLSVIIPAYNEERRLPKTLESVYGYLKNRGGKFEIIVVDDGSIDHTVDVVETFSQDKDNVRSISYAPNQGKGHAVRVGMLAALGDLVIFNDADGSSPISEIDKLEAAIARGADVAIGSRAKPDDSRVVEALAYRKYIGNTFNAIVRFLIVPGIHDTQCGFKMFRHDVAQDVFSVARMNGFAFDVELLYISKLRGYKIDEVPINWTNVEGSKVNVFFDSPKMFVEVLKVRLAAWMGKYRQRIAQKSRPAETRSSDRDKT